MVPILPLLLVRLLKSEAAAEECAKHELPKHAEEYITVSEPRPMPAARVGPSASADDLLHAAALGDCEAVRRQLRLVDQAC